MTGMTAVLRGWIGGAGTVLMRSYHNKILAGICLLFICAHVCVMQYGYAVSDRNFVVEHDCVILEKAGFYSVYSEDPAGYIRRCFQDMVAPWRRQGDACRLHTTVLAILFALFGKTVFVYKMSMIWALLGLALAGYCILYVLTRSEMVGLLGTLLMLLIPNIVAMSRTYFAFIPLACLFLWGACAFLLYLQDHGKRYFLLFCGVFYVASWTHYSAYLYFLVMGVLLLMIPRRRTSAGLFFLLYVGVLMMNIHQTLGLQWQFYEEGPLGGLNGIADKTMKACRYVIHGIFSRHYRAEYDILRYQFGGVVFYLYVFSAFLYALWHLKRKADDLSRSRFGIKILAAVLAGIALAMFMNDIVQLSNYVVFYVVGVLLFVLILWDMGRSGGPWLRVFSWSCLVGTVMAVSWNAPRPSNTYRMSNEMIDLSQLMHYLKNNYVPSGDKTIPAMVGFIEKDKAGESRWTCPPLFKGRPNIHDELITAQAFYGGVRLEWEGLCEEAGLSAGRRGDASLGKKKDISKEIPVLFVFTPQGSDVLPDRVFSAVKETAGNNALAEVTRNYRYLVHYGMGAPGRRLIVFRAKRGVPPSSEGV
ncbi:MAG TPA: hypothetical protein PK876_01670 [Elusimicrobiota bacterium]|nr:hypothetical protein [Elusimicrobiota bacterium]